jgi:hypothetical protein
MFDLDVAPTRHAHRDQEGDHRSRAHGSGAVARQGEPIQPEAFRARMEQVHDELMQRCAKKRLTPLAAWATVIQDSLDDGNFENALVEFIDDFVTYPTAFLRGPVVRKKKRLTWGPNFQPIVINDLVREFERISPHDVFPSPGSKGVNDGYLCIRHKLDTVKLEALRGAPGYNTDEIENAIATYGNNGISEWLNTDPSATVSKAKRTARCAMRSRPSNTWGRCAAICCARGDSRTARSRRLHL